MIFGTVGNGNQLLTFGSNDIIMTSGLTNDKHYYDRCQYYMHWDELHDNLPNGILKSKLDYLINIRAKKKIKVCIS